MATIHARGKQQLITVIEQIKNHYEALQTAGGDDRYFIAMKITRAAFGYGEEHNLPPQISNRIAVLERKIVNGKDAESIEDSVKNVISALEALL